MTKTRLDNEFWCPINLRQGGRIPLGKTATKVVAASDADPLIKLFADYVCDGTDDEVEINAAITALPAGGGKVMLSEGTFSVADSGNNVNSYDVCILVNKANVHLQGCGPATVIFLTSGEAAFPIAVTANDVHISDLQVDGNYPAAGGAAIDNIVLWTGVERCSVRNCLSIDAYQNGISCQADVKNCVIQGNICTGCVDVGIDFYGCESCVADGNTIEDCKVGLALFHDAHWCILSNNTIDTIWEPGIYLNDTPSENLIIGNTVYNAGSTTAYSAILCESGIGDNNVFIGNLVRKVAAARHGMDIYGKTLIANNTILELPNTGDGILVRADHSVCIGNRVEGTPAVGIDVVSNYCTVVGNQVELAWYRGINLAGNYNNCYGNTCLNSSGTDECGIRVAGDGNQVHGNTCSDDQGSKTQDYGVLIESTADATVVKDNYLTGNKTGAISNSGTNTVIRGNVGHTASGDVVTISLVIDHASLTDGTDATAYMDFAETIPAGSIIKAVKCDFTEAFNSDDTSTLTMMIGPQADLDAYNLTGDPGEDAFNHTTDVFWGEGDCQVHVQTAAAAPRVTFTEDDDGTDIINSTNAQGAVTVTITYMKA